ncbi:MAG: NUDIX domain-containing protein, partial [Pseudomonadota bacterium]|nr:NUDIX domain-containing protein [Pseudomonadota bacterium]
TGDPARFPMKTKKADRPHRRGIAYVLVDDQGRVAVETRPEKGLLGGMLGLPTSDWAIDEPVAAAPVEADWRDAGAVEHVFTHFGLTLAVMTARVDADGDYRWMPIEAARAALPTVFAKALDRASAPDLFG